MKYYVYIIYNKKFDKFYIGQTNNLKRRIFEHNNALSTYTSKYNGRWHFLYYEKFFNRKDAVMRERFLKGQKNKGFYKRLIITARVPRPRDLHRGAQTLKAVCEGSSPSLSTTYINLKFQNTNVVLFKVFEFFRSWRYIFLFFTLKISKRYLFCV